MLKKALKPLLGRKAKIAKPKNKTCQGVSPEVADTWCPLPWLGMGVRSVGDLRYCCHAQSSPEQGLLKDSIGNILNLKDDQIHMGKNAQLLKEVRLAMLKGEKPAGCRRCYREEEAGIFSRRQSEQVTWSDYEIGAFRRYTDDDGSISEDDLPIRYLDLRFGNRCNLKCRMCGPTESDKWYELTPKVWNGVTEFKDGDRALEITTNDKGQCGLKVDPYQWYESDRFWEELESYLPRLERIYLAGGEPLLIDAQFDFLQKCIDLGYSKNITLEYNSNITAITPKILKIWSQFHKIEIGMSVDGIGAINDYIRVGSQWDKIEKNLKDLDEAQGNFKLWWACTVQIYNLLHLPDMMRWVIQQDFHRINQTITLSGREILTPHPLSNPEFLSITTFPEVSKKKIGEIFSEEKKRIKDQIFSYELRLAGPGREDYQERLLRRFQAILDNYIHILNAKSTEHLKGKFWTYTNKLDEIHGTSFAEVCPETAELMC